MKTIIKAISLIGILFSFDNLVLAESLYSESLQARLIDIDKDGVISARDVCPDTPLGAAVDNNGCPTDDSTTLIFELNVLFDSGKSIVKPIFYSELKELASWNMVSMLITLATFQSLRSLLKLDEMLNKKSILVTFETFQFSIIPLKRLH